METNKYVIMLNVGEVKKKTELQNLLHSYVVSNGTFYK